jgi:hypothetical protein
MKKLSVLFLLLLPSLIFAQSKCAVHTFLGKDRKSAKTSVSAARTENFENVATLFKSLPSDDHMRSLTPHISKKPESARVDDENRNVTVKTAYLFSIKRESDNDFHVIIGSSRDTATAVLLNVEISGLPDTASAYYEVLKKVREKFIARFGNICTKKSFFNNPVNVEVSGSIFYDIDHPAGSVKFGTLRPKSSWEIHPVTGIEFR